MEIVFGSTRTNLYFPSKLPIFLTSIYGLHVGSCHRSDDFALGSLRDSSCKDRIWLRALEPGRSAPVSNVYWLIACFPQYHQF